MLNVGVIAFCCTIYCGTYLKLLYYNFDSQIHKKKKKSPI